MVAHRVIHVFEREHPRTEQEQQSGCNNIDQWYELENEQRH